MFKCGFNVACYKKIEIKQISKLWIQYNIYDDCVFFFSELPSPSFTDIAGRSVTLSFADPPPELTSDIERSITQYAVTLTPQDGGDPITAFVPAEAGAEITVPGLKPETMYSVEIEAVIDTAGQGEEIYNLGGDPLTIETSGCQ